MSNQTPLNAAHRALGARMVDFAGWEMPQHYGSQIAEHHAVRRDAGMFDVSHMLAVDVDGPGAAAFLEIAVANDVGKLRQAGAALYGCMLDDKAGIVDDLIVYLLAEGRYRAVVNAGTADKDIAWMERQLTRSGIDARITPRRDLGMIALQGPNARAKFHAALPACRAAAEPLRPFSAAQAGEFFVARTGYTGEDGYEIQCPVGATEGLWNSLLAQSVQPCGLGARDTLRLEAGLSLYGQDMDEGVTPLECGLAWTVDLRRARPFTGRAALEAAPPERERQGLVLLERGVLRARQKVRSAQGEGLITSGGFAPTLGKSIALARLPLGARPGDRVTVEIRGEMASAQVVKCPFVRHGKSLID